MNPNSRLGILYLVSGPSGSGKTTLCRRAADEGIAQYAVSATTRKPREGEVNGIAYHFLSIDEFKEKVDAKEFIEYANVHGNYYGTLKSEVITHLEAGRDIVMDIDVQGASFIRKVENDLLQTCIVDLFVMPESEDELESRLRNRMTDSEEVIKLRLDNSIEEMARWNEYTYLLVSGNKDDDYEAFRNILFSERKKVCRVQA